MAAAGLQTWVDVVGNVHGRLQALNPHAPALLMGSHYDTVIDAGRFDGALGIAVAIGAVKALHVEVIRVICSIWIIGLPFCLNSGSRLRASPWTRA